jgi:hypothetical protein
MIASFKNPYIVDADVKFVFIDERGADANGVSRDAYCGFWTELFLRFSFGEDSRVPAINSKWQDEEWTAVGRILTKGYRDHKFFPLQLSEAFTVALLLGEDILQPATLLTSFLAYLSAMERDIAQSAIDDTLDEEGHDDFVDLLDRFGHKSIPDAQNVKPTLLHIAHQELIQKPKYSMDKMSRTCGQLRILLPDCQEIANMYNVKKATVRKVLKLFNASPANAVQEQCFKYLQQFVRAQDDRSLRLFLRYLTGSDSICVDRISVSFTKTEGTSRGLIAHTCGPAIELPSTYLSYPEFRSEMESVLSNPESFRMDVA